MTRRATSVSIPLIALAAALGAQAGEHPAPPAAPAAAKAVAIGQMAPSTDVKMTSVDGREVSIADVRGEKGTVVVFTCNHCPYVKAWETRIAALLNGARAKGLGAVAINPNDPGRVPEDGLEAMQARAKDRGFQFPYVVDAGSSVARAFGASRTPEVFLLDAKGTVVYHGAVDDHAESAEKATQHFLRDAMDALVAGQEVRTKETKAIGCSIKLKPAV
jgi:peroxiredoxin